MSVVFNLQSENRSVVSDSLQPPWTDYTVHGIFQARILESVASLLQGIFPTQGSNPGLLHCRQILYQLSHQGSKEKFYCLLINVN